MEQQLHVFNPELKHGLEHPMVHINEIITDIHNELSMLWYHKYGSMDICDLELEYDIGFIEEMVEILSEGVISILNFEQTRLNLTNQDYEAIVVLVDEQVEYINGRIDDVNATAQEHDVYPEVHIHIGPIIGWGENLGLFAWVRSGIMEYQRPVRFASAAT